jgi:ribosomal protein S18 acetylase RimI-like enzyme
VVERPLTRPPDLTFRPATEADHARCSRLLREWWDERPPRLDRLWFRHFAATTLIGETADGRPAALVAAFPSASLPGHGVLLAVAVAPSMRRQGIGRAAVEATVAALREAGVGAVEAAVWPGNRIGIRFLEGLGFAFVPESLATPLYGVPALADYDGDGEDRAVMTLRLPPAAG